MITFIRVLIVLIAILGPIQLALMLPICIYYCNFTRRDNANINMNTYIPII